MYGCVRHEIVKEGDVIDNTQSTNAVSVLAKLTLPVILLLLLSRVVQLFHGTLFLL